MQVRSNVVLQAVPPTKYRALFLWEATPQTNGAPHPNTLHFPTCLPCLCSCPPSYFPSLPGETLPPPKAQLKFHLLCETANVSLAKSNTFPPLAPRGLHVFASYTGHMLPHALLCISPHPSPKTSWSQELS